MLAAMFGRVIVVNPNSTESISVQIDDAVRGLAAELGIGIEVVTCADGPPAIESDDEVTASVGPMIQTAIDHPADAYVVACFSDPGIQEMRSTLDAPVFGIAESAVLSAMSRGRRVGVISALDTSIPRHDGLLEPNRGSSQEWWGMRRPGEGYSISRATPPTRMS